MVVTVVTVVVVMVQQLDANRILSLEAFVRPQFAIWSLSFHLLQYIAEISDACLDDSSLLFPFFVCDM